MSGAGLRPIAGARLIVDLAKIEANAASVCGRLSHLETTVTAVTKVTCGDSRVAAAMLDGGVAALGDSRLSNLEGLRRAGLNVPLWLLRAPTPSLAAETVRVANVSLNSEIETVFALDSAAEAAGVNHSVVLMIDVGDLREGIMPEELPDFLARSAGLKHARITGIGTNLTCYGGIVPTAENLRLLLDLAAFAEECLGCRLLVSGGNSSSLELAFAGGMPAGIGNLRVGESILLGVSTITREPLPGLHQDAFVVETPVIETRVKPSLPVGEIAQDAFGGHPTFADRGRRRRAICALGRQDAIPESLRPLEPGVEILGASSDHLLLDVEHMRPAPVVGDTMRFIPAYGSLLQAFTSPYVDKIYAPPDGYAAPDRR